MLKNDFLTVFMISPIHAGIHEPFMEKRKIQVMYYIYIQNPKGVIKLLF